jgi:two-component system C4-dicarboxylate transport sensor histidine kinase DctB
MSLGRRRSLIGGLVAVMILAALLWTGDRWSRARAHAAADLGAEQASRTHAALLESELQKFRLLPLVLGEYPDVANTLRGERAARDRLNATLELLAGRTDAADLYVIGPDGVTVAASNWRRPTSFVGQNYGFRPYFRDAMRAGSAELFALGTVSRRPGLYLARRVARDGRPIGVVVVKVEFDAVEQAWARTSGASFVADANGVILVTSRPEWRFQTLGDVSPAVAAVARRTLQFGSDVPRRAPIAIDGRSARLRTSGADEQFRIFGQPAPMQGGRLYHLAPLAAPMSAARTQALLLGLAILFLLTGAAAWAYRASETRRIQRAARMKLEEEVSRRTAELVEADARYRAAREELAQANRLGTLGQVTAGVAHEINQPVAAIRTFAENGVRLLDRGTVDVARENFERIAELTARIGRITSELRGFARKRTRSATRATVASVIDGLLVLLGERVRNRLVVLADLDARALSFRGERVRIEQVLVNLVQNAFEAVGESAEGRVSLEVREEGNAVRFVVSDNGPGVPDGVRENLFTPFVTAKAQGLGLGLAIARDIAREFGGDLAYAPAHPRGARFTLSLPRA